jgi:hypothetical protein
MPMITCSDCNNQISDSAPACPNCGKPNSVEPLQPAAQNKSVSILLGLGIFLLPIVFAWVTLKKGYSPLVKVVSFVWLALFIIPMASNNSGSGTTTSVSTTQVKAKTYPVSTASYAEVNSEVGCGSKYSDNKKEDIFKANYKNHWFTWRGEVSLAESDEASINLDGFGTQDLQVDFADSKAGYDLVKGSRITVKFLMKTAGGCFLPFSGYKAVTVQ